MKLYHGTSARHLRRILESGIQPRGKRKSTWEHASRPDAVYLTSGAYAVHFAKNAVRGSEDVLIVEVEITCLTYSQLVPDEDCLEQVTRTCPEWSHIGRTMAARTKWFRDRLHEFQAHWADSLKCLGTCAYLGNIPQAAITQAITIRNTHPILWLVDPSISILNYQILGPQYDTMMKWFMGGNVLPQDIVSSKMLELNPEYKEQVERVLMSREGWKKVYP